jgi:putative transposase
LVGKYQKDITGIEEKIISMYAKGMTVRDIQSFIGEIYGGEVSPQTISNITDRVLPLMEEWRNRQLKEIYAITYIDGIRFNVRSNGQVKDKTVYGVIGIDLEGNKDVLGLWIAETESAKYWLGVLTELRNRGLKDILIITSDDLSGIQEAIKAVYPDAAYQGCVVHIIRNSLKYVSWKDMKEFSIDIKPIYKSPTEEAALLAFDELKKKWYSQYKLAVDVWERNWSRMRTMFSFTEEVRVLIYTTNPIESFNRQLRKVTKNRSIFPDDTAALKLIYLATCEVIKKWTMKIKDWNRILAQLSIHFEDRLKERL